MPTYQYACTECGERLEAVQSFSDPALTVCPACQGKLRKVFNSVGIVFKGSGFYRNDSRAGAVSAEKAAGNGNESTTKSDTKSDSKSDTKSDKKADSTSTSASTSSTSSSSSSTPSSGSSSNSSSGGGAKAAATS